MIDVSGEPVTHPNQYFEMSYARSRPDGDVAGAAGKWKGRRKRDDEVKSEVKAEDAETGEA